MQIGVLAIQGAFVEHIAALKKLGVDSFEIRQLKDIDRPMDGLILPGGESTTMGKLLHDLGLFQPLQDKIKAGLPVFGTCAGLILLANKLSNDERIHFQTMDVTVERNAYGRQLGSFNAIHDFDHIKDFPMVFIRAPYITHVGKDVHVLATIDQKIVAARQGHQLGTAFHPELSDDTRIHAYFIDMIQTQ